MSCNDNNNDVMIQDSFGKCERAEEMLRPVHSQEEVINMKLIINVMNLYVICNMSLNILT